MDDNGRYMIAVGSCDAENVLRARNQAAAVFGTCVSPVVAGNSDRYQAFFVACARVISGGCNDFAGARRKYQRWLRWAETDGPAAQVGWIEVKYNTKRDSLAVMACSDPSTLTFEGVGVLAGVLGLSVRQLLHDLCARRAVCGADDFDAKNSPMQDKFLSRPYDMQQFSSQLGSVCPGRTSHLALEFFPEHIQSEPDADLIRLCRCFLDIDSQIAQVHGRRERIQDERRTNREITVLSDKRRRIEEALYHAAAPTTLEGAQAMAKLALAIWLTTGEDGKPVARDFREWLSLSVMEFLAELRSAA